MKTWLITGASRGLGRAIAEEVLARGDNVIAAIRKVTDLGDLAVQFPETLLVVAMDATDGDSMKTAVAAAVKKWPVIDILINNAGTGMHGAIEEVSHEETQRAFEINVFGLLRMTRTVLPVMRAQGFGHIINISSVAGLVAAPGTGIYAATKFAVEGATESMDHELKPLGIQVTLIEPGPFRTDFYGSSFTSAKNKIADYADTAAKRSSTLREGSGQQPGDPVKAAKAICDIGRAPDAPLRLLLGNKAVNLVKERYAARQAEREKWETVSRATDFDT
ncbi:MAG: SDR family NAD(P)-dependent oxidoreductase [Rhodobacteraceae bacterium]|nr:SDR family NAD(P)-dependent oxidoreductase [Paracoccaceae bacterium]